ncbi:hypothetical protein ART_3813 [Arthrobacter sp. PAMC 25486]|nr:hypothetical protein ART_3813 [Arthrobacter sp. PAMC 25486]
MTTCHLLLGSWQWHSIILKTGSPAPARVLAWMLQSHSNLLAGREM